MGGTGPTQLSGVWYDAIWTAGGITLGLAALVAWLVDRPYRGKFVDLIVLLFVPIVGPLLYLTRQLWARRRVPDGSDLAQSARHSRSGPTSGSRDVSVAASGMMNGVASHDMPEAVCSARPDRGAA